MPPLLRRLWRGFLAHRKRFAPLVVLIGAVVVGGEIFAAMPQETEIQYRLGPDHDAVREARISYVLEGEAVKGARFSYGHGAPATLRHRVELAPGRYEVVVELVAGDHVRRIRRRLQIPAEGEVRIDLRDESSRTAPPTVLTQRPATNSRIATNVEPRSGDPRDDLRIAEAPIGEEAR